MFNYSERFWSFELVIKSNSKIGELKINIDNEEHIYDLIVKEDIKKANYFEVLANLFKDIINGKINVIFGKK